MPDARIFAFCITHFIRIFENFHPHLSSAFYPLTIRTSANYPQTKLIEISKSHKSTIAMQTKKNKSIIYACIASVS